MVAETATWQALPFGARTRYNAAHMRHRAIVIALGLAVLLAGCGSTDERQWMKIGERYTVEEFRRDHAACSRSGKLDDACMRERGWVAVNPRVEKVEPQPASPRPGGRY